MKGTIKMIKESLLEELKKDIEIKRKELHRMINKEIDKDELLKYSVELDEVIGKYYSVKLNKK
ncbi:aspartyl-phosphate phosphatase Spo0E family protein [Schnuerera sp. xch1]|uniref:aspartyl-phosphate phosphatase Spo0E family protein n=1 Tax=Schnuerera sp. xch1 TaxID=2874283 RepID=UPI001CBD5D15|nr:aspartyl-phosphate phosphatase Spo0E family protein [Schnuerera sp. xch1]MBZ2174233.1 aspartyl-phosphate phosphatase Spo0E family protein [Schnuerera sp. xch1]